jgi:hypothetical protein
MGPLAADASLFRLLDDLIARDTGERPMPPPLETDCGRLRRYLDMKGQAKAKAMLARYATHYLRPARLEQGFTIDDVALLVDWLRYRLKTPVIHPGPAYRREKPEGKP